MHYKLGFVFLLYVYHLACHKIFLQLQKDEGRYSSMQLRIFNEVATIILFAIVFLIIVKSELSWVWGILGLFSLGVILMVAIKLYKRIRSHK